LVIEAFVLSILIGFARRGRLHNLGRAPLRYVYMFVPPFAILAGAEAIGFAKAVQAWQPYLMAANIIQYVTLLAAIALNFHIREMWLAGIGTFLNFLAIAANGGMMPMSTRALQIAGIRELLDPERISQFVRHAIMAPETRLKLLADVIPVPGFSIIITPQVASIGDLLVAVAVFLFIQRYMLAPAADLKEKPTGG